MATWAPGTRVIDKGLGGGPRPHVRGFIPHIGAGYSVLGFVSNKNSRDNYPTYHIGQDGRVHGIVHPNRRPWTTAHSVDSIAATCEMDNSGLAPDYPVTQATLSALVDLIVHHAREGGFKRVVLNRVGVDQTREGFFVGFHRQYHAVACPGDWVWSRRQWIVDEANRRLAGKAPAEPSTPVSAPAAPAAAGWELAPGGEPGAPHWPVGPLMARIQRALQRRNRYAGRVDGVGGPLTARGIQETLNISECNGVGRAFVRTPVDGRLGRNNAYGVQWYARKHGDYRGPIDGDPREQSWAGFALGLERP